MKNVNVSLKDCLYYQYEAMMHKTTEVRDHLKINKITRSAFANDSKRTK